MLALTLEARAAAAGIVRLVRGDPAWDRGFDLTVGGFVRSFIGPILALPLYVAAVALVEHAPSDAVLWQAALAHVLDAFGFPLLLAIISGPMRFKAGFAAFVTVNNWAALYLTIALVAASLVALLGPAGEQAFSLCSLVLLCVSVLIVWRLARETLSHELAAIVLVVVLSLAWGAFADVGAGQLIGG